MSETKKKFKFNLIDAIVIVVILAAVAFLGIKVFGGGLFGGEDEIYVVKFFCEDVPDFAAEVIYVDDKITDEQKDTDLGFVTEVNVGPSQTYVHTDDGQYVLAPRENYNSVEVIGYVRATGFENGIVADGTKYGVGHSLTLRVGKAKIYGRVSGIEKVSDEDLAAALAILEAQENKSKK